MEVYYAKDFLDTLKDFFQLKPKGSLSLLGDYILHSSASVIVRLIYNFYPMYSLLITGFLHVYSIHSIK